MHIRNRVVAAATTALLALSATAALAHHGWSSYDRSKPLKLTGKVTALSYANPHATINIDAEGKSWLAVLAPPARLAARGIGSDDIQVGAEATVEGFPSKETPGEMRAERITFGGKRYELR